MKDQVRLTQEIVAEMPMGTIDDYLEKYRERGAWTVEDKERHWDAYCKAEVRKALAQIKDEQGRRMIYNFSTRDEAGRVIKTYVEETLFDAARYQTLNSRQRATVKRECVELIGIVERANERYDLGILVPEEVRNLALEL